MSDQKFNLHTHTDRCGHAKGLDIQYVNSEIISSFAKVSNGFTILANAVININTLVGVGCIINTAVIVKGIANNIIVVAVPAKIIKQL